MMSASLHQLEQDVETARRKLTSDLATLRAPATVSEFTEGLKNEAYDVKDALIDKAKSSAHTMLEEFVDDLKGKAAANPAAALAIAAGVAWQMIRRPPIASALVGLGLVSLWRTSPVVSNKQTADYLSEAKGRLAEQASDLAGAIKDEAVSLKDTVAEKATDFAGAAKEQMQEWSAATKSAVGLAAAEVGDQASSLLKQTAKSASESAESVKRAADEWTKPARATLEDPETRDKLLLGVAGVAVVAALSFACQRRIMQPSVLN